MHEHFDNILLGIIGGVFALLVIPLIRGLILDLKKRICNIQTNVKKIESELHTKIDKLESTVYKKNDNLKDTINTNNLKTQDKLNNINLNMVSLKEKIENLLNLKKGI